MTQHSPYHETDTLAATEVADSAAFSAASVITGELAATEGVGCTDPVGLASMDRLLQSPYVTDEAAQAASGDRH